MTKIIERVRKLLALAGNNPNEEEAAAAAQKAQELLIEHNLSLSDVEEDPEDPLCRTEYDPKYADPWRRSIVFSAAQLYMCKALNSWTHYYTAGGQLRLRKSFVFIGRKHNTEVAREMADYLISTTHRLGLQYSSVRREMLRFERGCGERLSERLDEMYWAQVRPSNAASGLPALYKNTLQEANDWAEANIKITRSSVRGSSLDGYHSAAGASAADRVNLGPQVRSSGAGNLLK